VLENYLGMVADYPEAYEGKQGFDFVKTVPTVWDDTKVVAAKLDQYAVIARKKNSNWWLGAINNLEKREINISLAFLGDEKYRAYIYMDDQAPESDPNQLLMKEQEVSGSDMLLLNLSGSGGAAIRFEKQ
jgi:alpha-glucosidase